MNSTIYQDKDGFMAIVGIQDGHEYSGPILSLEEAHQFCIETEKIMNGNDLSWADIPVIDRRPHLLM